MENTSTKARGAQGKQLTEGKAHTLLSYIRICQWVLEKVHFCARLSHAHVESCVAFDQYHAVYREHMSWESDALGILFAHSKTSTTGDQAGHIRHVSANPLHPVIWTVLSLGLFSTIFPRGDTGPWCDGKSQYDRFREILHGVLMEDDICALGIEPENMDVHSIRKVADRRQLCCHLRSC